MSLPLSPKPPLRRFHQARWDEPLIFDLSAEGERGVLVSRPEPDVVAATGSLDDVLPEVERWRAAALA